MWGQLRPSSRKQWTVDEQSVCPSWAAPPSVEFSLVCFPSWLCELSFFSALPVWTKEASQQDWVVEAQCCTVVVMRCVLGQCRCTQGQARHFPPSRLQRVNGFEKTVGLQLVMGTGLQVWEIRGQSSGGPGMENCMEIVDQVQDGNGTQRFAAQRDEGIPETSPGLCWWFIEAVGCAALLCKPCITFGSWVQVSKSQACSWALIS